MVQGVVEAGEAEHVVTRHPEDMTRDTHVPRGAGAVLPDWLHVDGEADGAHGVGQVHALPGPGVQLPDYRGHLDT